MGAAVTFYGGGVTEGRFGFPPLVEEATRLGAPWLGLYGDLDQGIPVDDVEQLREAAAGSGQTTGIVRYPEAGHGFHCDQRASFEVEVGRGRLGPHPGLVQRAPDLIEGENMRSSRRLVALVSLALAAGLLAGCGEETDKLKASDGPAEGGGNAITPVKLTAHEGREVEIAVTNTAKDKQHGFKIDEFEVEEVIDQGKTTTVKFKADKAGHVQGLLPSPPAGP